MRVKTKQRLLILALVAVVLAAGLCGLFVFRQGRAAAYRQHRLEQGLAAYEAQNHQAVIEHLGFYINQTHTRDPDVLYKFALSRRQVETTDYRHLIDAMNILGRVVQIDPAHHEARRELLELLTLAGRNNEALELAQTSLNLNPEDPVALRARSLALIRLRRYEEALPVTEHYARVARHDLLGYFMVLDILQMLGREPNEIVQRADQLLEAHPDEPRFEVLKGYAYALIGDRENAQKWVRSASQRRFDDPQLIRALLLQFDSLSLFDEAVTLLQQSVDVSADLSIRREHVRRLWESNRIQDLLETLADFDALSSDADPEIAAFKAMGLIRAEQMPEAQTIIAALSGRENSAPARAWGLFLDQSGQARESAQQLLQVCQEALKLDPQNPYIRYSLGEAYASLGEHELALEAWRRAANARPSWSLPLSRVAALLVDTGRGSMALPVAAAALQRLPDDAEAVITMAEVRAAVLDPADRREAADLLEMVEQIQQQVPGESRTLPIHIDLLARTRSRDAAVSALRAALAMPTPPSEQALLQLAGVSREHGLGLEEACYDHYEQAYGRTSQLVFTRAMLRASEGDLAGGLALIEAEVNRAAPADRVSWRLLEARYRDLIDDPQAGQLWAELIEQQPDNIQVQREAMNAEAVHANRQLMDQVIERVRRHSGDNAVGWRLARARWLLGSEQVQRDAARAATLLNDVLRVSPDRAEAYALLADALTKLGNTSGAIEQLTRAADLQTDRPEYALDLARMLLGKGDLVRARQYLDQVLDSKLADASLRRHAAAMLAEAGQLNRAASILAELGSDGSVSDDLLMAELYRRQGRFDDLEPLCVRLLASGDAHAIAFCADYFAARGRGDEAQAALEALAQANASESVRAMLLGDYETRHGEAARADAHYRRALAQAPDDVQLWERYLTYLILQGDVAAIRAALDEARPVYGEESELATLARHHSLIQSLGPTLDANVRPILLLILQDSENEAVAVEVLQLLRDAQGQGGVSDQTLVRLRSLADRYSLLWALQRVVVALHVEAGRYDDAAALASRAMRTFPTEAEPAALTADAYASAGRWAEALDAARQWRNRQIENPLPPDSLISEALLQLGQPRQVLTVLEPYLSTATADPDAFAGLISRVARAWLNLGEVDRATQMFADHAGRSPRLRALWAGLAADAVRDPAVAVRWLNQAVDLPPTPDAEMQVALALAWFRLAQRLGEPAHLQRTRALVEPWLEGEQARDDALLLRAFLAEIDGDRALAAGYYRRSIQLNDTQAVAMNNLAMILADEDRAFDEALDMARRAVAADPSMAAYQHTLAHVQGLMGRWEQAAATISEAIRLEPQSIEWHLFLGQAQVQAGQLAAAGRTAAQIDRLVRQGVPISDEQRERLQSLHQTVSSAAAVAP